MDRAERILVVDDEKVIRTVIADTLEAKGYAVQTAANADEALQKFQECAFDLALVDLKMPGALDGLQFLERVHARWPATWVIVPPEDSEKGGVFDVHSGAPGNARDGTPYSSW